jgi:soluble lytic murein transglycosylase-like protein
MISFNYSPVIGNSLGDYYRLKSFYPWLSPKVYYHIKYETSKYNHPQVNIDKICAIIQYESGGYCKNNLRKMTKVTSHAGAIGLMQIMPFHHKGPKKELKRVSLNIYYGVNYYSYCIKLAKGNEREALRFYNAGPHSSRNKYRNWHYVDSILKANYKSLMAYNG